MTPHDRRACVDEVAALADEPSPHAPIVQPVILGKSSCIHAVDDLQRPAGTDQVQCVGDGGRPSPVEPGHQCGAGGFPRGNDVVELLLGDGKRLLTEHVLSRFEGLDGEAGMGVVPGGDEDDGDTVIGDELPRIGGDHDFRVGGSDPAGSGAGRR